MQRPPLAREIPINSLNRPRHRAPPLPQRIQPDTERREEQPENPNRDPTGEELLRKHVPRPIHGHGPEDEQTECHDDGHDPAELGRFLELGLLGGLFLGAARVPAGDELEIDVGGGREVAVVTLADGFHRLPVVGLRLESEGEDGDEDEGG